MPTACCKKKYKKVMGLLNFAKVRLKKWAKECIPGLF